MRKNCLIQVISTLALLFSLIEPTWSSYQCCMPFWINCICVMHNTNVMKVFWCELICSICRCPRLPFCDCWHFNVTLRFGTVNCEYQYYRMWAFCWCFQWVAKGIWFMHFHVFFSWEKNCLMQVISILALRFSLFSPPWRSYECCVPFSDKVICVVQNTNVLQVFSCELLCFICRYRRLVLCVRCQWRYTTFWYC